MQNNRGLFIVLEGSDGSGKTTQFKLLAERLKAVGYEVAVFDFPRYDEPSSHFVRNYLGGKYGPASQISPYSASLFYALDRFEAASEIKKKLADGKIVLSNRYVGSNMAHQGSKFSDPAQQRGFFIWADSLEFELLGIPRPNLNLFLKVPATISRQLIENRSASSGVKPDEHENNIDHLERAVGAYDLLCKLFPKDFYQIECTVNGEILSIVEINDLIWKVVKPLLPQPRHKAKGAILHLNEALGANTATAGVKAVAPKIKSRDKHVSPGNDRNIILPANLDANLEPLYRETLSQIAQLQNQIRQSTRFAKRTSKQDLDDALKLLTPLGAAGPVIDSVLTKITKATTSTERAKTSPNEQPAPLDKIIEQIERSRLTQQHSDNGDLVTLMEASPRNEFQLLPTAKFDTLAYRQKGQVLDKELAMGMDRPIYRFDVTGNYLTLKQLIEQELADELQMTPASLLLGYDMPEVIEIAGLEEQFSKCFNLSAGLYNKIRVHGQQSTAINALLLGHKARWQFAMSAAALKTAMLAGKDKKYVMFLEILISKIAEIHPHVAQTLMKSHSRSPKLGAQKTRQRGRRNRN